MILLIALIAQESYRQDAVGLELEKPKGWSVTEDEGGQDVLLKITLVHPEGAGQAFATIRVAEAPTADPGPVRDWAEGILRKRSDCSDVKASAGKISGLDSASVSCRIKASNGTWESTYHYVVGGGLLFVFETATTAAHHAKALKRLVESVRLKPAEEWKKLKEWRRLAAKCGSELPWAASWKDASTRARKEGKPVFLVLEMFLGYPFPPVATSGIGVDPDLVELVRERFVPMRASAGEDGPFRQDLYGIPAHTWGRAVLFADAEGRVLGDASNIEPAAVYAAAIAFLRPRVVDGDDPAALIRSGKLERANELLREPKSAGEWLLRADLCRKLRKGEEALKALAKARADAADAPALDLDEAIVRMRMGRMEEARRMLGSFAREHAKHARAPEAVFWLGAVRLYLGDAEGGRREWSDLAGRWPESRWAWKAAANLLGTGALLQGQERLDWASPALLEAFTHAPTQPAADRAVEDAVAYLLRTQREEGTWIAPFELYAAAFELVVSTTALCARSLVPFAERKDVRTAIERALRTVLKEEVLRWTPRQIGGFDYSVWIQICTLDLVSACWRAKIGDSGTLEKARERLVAGLERLQLRLGGWTYLPALGRTGKGDASISFVTAAGLLALLDAGVKPDARVAARAAECLETLRSKDGSFQYFAGETMSSDRGACGRSPGCALALRLAGRGDGEGVRTATAIYLRHRESLRKELGKSLMHAGPEGQGSHYLLFDYALAARALGELSGKERSGYRKALLEDVLAARRVDGSFADCPILGRPVGAAMALLALERLKE